MHWYALYLYQLPHCHCKFVHVYYCNSIWAEYTFSPLQADIICAILGLTEYFYPLEITMFPSYLGYVFTEGEAGQKHMNKLPWGLIPPWAKDPKEGRKFFNARAETVHEKCTYRSAFKSRRCLVPVTGWYEWKQGTKPKQKYFIAPEDNVPFVFAGIWQTWTDKEGKEIGSYSFLTVNPHGHLAGIHDRMRFLSLIRITTSYGSIPRRIIATCFTTTLPNPLTGYRHHPLRVTRSQPIRINRCCFDSAPFAL